jgi:hypothetical protein
LKIISAVIILSLWSAKIGMNHRKAKYNDCFPLEREELSKANSIAGFRKFCANF